MTKLLSNVAFYFNFRRHTMAGTFRAGCSQRGVHHYHGRPLQVDPIKPQLKLPGIKLLKLTCDILLSTSACNLNLRRYIMAGLGMVGRCRLPASKPVLKSPMESALETKM